MSDVSQADLACIFSGRDVIYSFLYDLFITPPSEELYKKLSDILPNLKTVASNFKNEENRKSTELLEKFINERRLLSGKELRDFDMDTLRFYTRIFCLSNSVMMCESNYANEERLSRLEAQDDCISLYAQFKIPKDKRYFEDEDFISNQFRFMAFLSSRASEALIKDHEDDFKVLQTAQKSFIDNHLNKWVNKFIHSVLSFPESRRLYGAAALFVAGFIESDKEFLSYFE